MCIATGVAAMRKLEPVDEGRGAEAAATDHLANQRTLLAWVRTSVQIIALGIVVLQFIAKGTSGGWGHLIGIGLIALGGLTAAFGGIDYLRGVGDLERGRYRPVPRLSLTVIAVIALAAVLLIGYVALIH